MPLHLPRTSALLLAGALLTATGLTAAPAASAVTGDGSQPATGYRTQSLSLTETGTGDEGYVTTVGHGDLDGDGHSDVVVALSDTTLRVLQGDGTGALTPLGDPITEPPTHQDCAGPGHDASGGTPAGIAVGDLNGDGFSDVAATYYGTDQVVVYLGDGQGSFTAVQQRCASSAAGPIAVVDDLAGPALVWTEYGTEGYGVLAVSTFDGPGSTAGP